MSTIDRFTFVLAPTALASATVLAVFAADAAPLGDLWRPLSVAIALTVIVQLLATAGLRGSAAGAYAATTFVAVVGQIAWLAGVLIAVPAWWALVAALRRRSGRPGRGAFPLETAGRAIAAVATVFLLMSAGRVILAVSDTGSDAQTHEISLAGSETPDIFLLVLDGYPRADTLAGEFGIDNGPFMAALERRGFFVDRDSRSNYMKTWLSLASLLHLAYVDDIDLFEAPPSDPAAQYRLASRAILQAPFADALRARGYQVAAGASAFTETSLATADRVLDPGYPTNFEVAVMRSTLAARLIDWLAPTALPQLHVDQIRQGLDDLARVAEEPSTQPLFMLAHVDAPHTPFVADVAGRTLPMPGCFPSTCNAFDHYIGTLGWTADEYGERLAGYLSFTNDLVLQSLDAVIAARPDAVIIVMSDHGARFDPEDPQEHFRNLLAARTPGREDVYRDGTDVADVFRLLSNAYFDAEFTDLPTCSWFSDGKLFDLVPVELQEASVTPGEHD